MFSKPFLNSLRKSYVLSEKQRRQIITLSSEILSLSKKAIFAMHRNDIDRGNEILKSLTVRILAVQKQYGADRLLEEGSYRAGMEEFLEAKFFTDFVNGKKIDAPVKIKVETEAYLGAICDLSGEMLRYAVNQAASGNFGAVKAVKEEISFLAAELTDLDMTGYLRTKYDQARSNLKKIEQMDYEINLKIFTKWKF